jgi:hypothetical protein
VQWVKMMGSGEWVGVVIYAERHALFLHKRYSAAYPLLSFFGRYPLIRVMDARPRDFRYSALSESPFFQQAVPRLDYVQCFG